MFIIYVVHLDFFLYKFNHLHSDLSFVVIPNHEAFCHLQLSGQKLLRYDLNVPDVYLQQKTERTFEYLRSHLVFLMAIWSQLLFIIRKL